MSKKKNVHIELRYYEIPQNEYALALLGDTWKRVYRQDANELHFHSLMEIGYCHYGDGEVAFQNREPEHYADDTFSVIPQNTPHGTWSYAEVENYWEYLFIDVESVLTEIYRSDAIFAHELIARINKKAHVSDVHKNPVLAESIRAVMTEKRKQQEYGSEVEKCLVLRLLLEIARLNPNESLKSDHPLKQRKVIVESLKYVNEHYADPIKINVLAESCHMSETHFRRVFQDTIHMKPVDYINFVRIQKACELLNGSNDTIENIAINVGFITQSTFNRNFLRVVGVPPHKWKAAADNYNVKNQKNYKITALKGW